MSAKRDTSNSGIYDKLEALRLEFKEDLISAVNSVAISQGRLEKKFDDLEAGRLTRAEGNISDLRLLVQRLSDNTTSAEKTLSSKFIAIGTVGVILLTGISTAFFAWLFKGMK